MTGPNPAAGLTWSGPYPIERVRDERSLLAASPGVYVFTNHSGMLVDSLGVWYVGKASRLSRRLPSYLADPAEILLLAPRRKDGSLNSSLRHAGKVQLLMKIQQRMAYGGGSSGIWVRWTVCQQPERLEREMISYFQPAFNTSLNPR